MNKRLYLAYGSNLNIPQMKRRCMDAQVVGTSVIEGYRLMFKGSKTGSYLTIEEEEGAQVPVAVWEVSEQDERVLDCYEGYPNFYYKKEMVLPIKNIKTGKTRRRKAFVYIMHEERQHGIPSNLYVHTCAEGYRSFGFDIGVLLEALDYSRERVEK